MAGASYTSPRGRASANAGHRHPPSSVLSNLGLAEFGQEQEAEAHGLVQGGRVHVLESVQR